MLIAGRSGWTYDCDRPRAPGRAVADRRAQDGAVEPAARDSAQHTLDGAAARRRLGLSDEPEGRGVSAPRPSDCVATLAPCAARDKGRAYGHGSSLHTRVINPSIVGSENLQGGYAACRPLVPGFCAPQRLRRRRALPGINRLGRRAHRLGARAAHRPRGGRISPCRGPVGQFDSEPAPQRARSRVRNYGSRGPRRAPCGRTPSG